MKLGIISDTHDNLRSIAKAFDIFRKANATTIIHCGDWVAPFALSFIGQQAALRSIAVYGVIGNNVGDLPLMFEKNAALANPIHLTKHEYLELPFGTKRTVIHHGHNTELLSHLMTSGAYNVVFSGHTHMPEIRKYQQTLFVNPGATCFVQNGESVDEASVAVYDTEVNTAEIVTYRWSEI